MTLSRWIAFILQLLIGITPFTLIMFGPEIKSILSRLMRSGR